MSQYYTYPEKLLHPRKGGVEMIKPIINEVCRTWNITPNDLKRKTRARAYSEPFHIVSVLLIEFTNIHRDDIDSMFNRKRTASYNSEKVVYNLEFSNVKFREKMRMIRSSLSQTFYSIQHPAEALEPIRDDYKLENASL